MTLSHFPTLLLNCFTRLASALDCRSALRLPVLLAGLVFASGRRTCTAWFRAAGIGDDFRRGYNVVWACGQRAEAVASRLLPTLDPLLAGKRLLVGLDDTPTARYGECIEGAGIHRNPTPGPAGEKFLYGHVWVTLAALVRHPQRGTVALPLLNKLYIRAKDIDKLDKDHQVPFRTKLQLAAEQLHWLRVWRGNRFEEIWAVTDGAYAKRPLLRAARQEDIVFVGRLAHNAALFSLPPPRDPHRRGRPPIYGKERIVLHLRAGQSRGWEQIECVLYGEKVTKTVKTFLATWKPAGGMIRVVLVQEADGWRAYFCTKTEATVQEILEAVADRGALEQTNHDVKEVWGADQQQVRNLQANVGCFNLNGWMYSLVEAWAWDRPEEELVDRSTSPWDDAERRPSHADKRKALQKEVLRAEIEEVLEGDLDRAKIRALAERLLERAA